MRYEVWGGGSRTLGIKINFTHAKNLQIIFAGGYHLKINNNSIYHIFHVLTSFYNTSYGKFILEK